VKGSCEHGNEPSEFHKMLENSSVTAQVAASQEGLRSMELVTWKILLLESTKFNAFSHSSVCNEDYEAVVTM
jgi:hypothetical protein